VTPLAPSVALFDLDHTLVPFDSGMRWIRFLVGHGVLAPQVADDYLQRCRDYVDGRLDIAALHRFALGALCFDAQAAVLAWQARFKAELTVPAATRALVARHQSAGDLCCIVTTTNEVVAAPYAAAFGIDHLLATRAEVQDGRYTGSIVGAPCHGAEKVRRVDAWLEDLGLDRADLAGSVFYTDAASDLPLLESVDEAVAVNPEPALRRCAVERGWHVLEPFTPPAGAAR